jgi:hypothetical protein
VIEWIADKLVDIRQLILAIGVIAAIVFVLSTWWRTKAAVPTFVAMLLSGAVLWAVANIDWFKEKIGEETSLGERQPVIRIEPSPPWTFPEDPGGGVV